MQQAIGDLDRTGRIRQARARITTSPSASSLASNELDPAPRADDLGAGPQMPDRHRPEDLEGDAADVELGGILEALDRVAEQRRRRARVLGVRIPGAAGQLGGG